MKGPQLKDPLRIDQQIDPAHRLATTHPTSNLLDHLKTIATDARMHQVLPLQTRTTVQCLPLIREQQRTENALLEDNISKQKKERTNIYLLMIKLTKS